MTKAETLFHHIASGIPDTKEAKMFGALCIKSPNGKAGVMYWQENMIFKLKPLEFNNVLKMDGAKIFEPMPGKPMGGWVQLSYDYAELWKDLAHNAMAYVRTL